MAAGGPAFLSAKPSKIGLAFLNVVKGEDKEQLANVEAIKSAKLTPLQKLNLDT